MKNMGDGRRKSRVEKEVQEVISGFIIRQLRHDLPGVVTVTRVTMPADFRTANIYVTYFAAANSEKNAAANSEKNAAANDEKTTSETDNKNPVDAAEVLQSWAADMQDEIGHVMKMRYCPKLTFYNDETTEKILKIEKLISEISKDPTIKARLDEEDID